MDEDVADTTAENTERPIEELEQPDLIVATYHDEATARTAFNALRDLQKDQQVLLADIAIVMRDAPTTPSISTSLTIWPRPKELSTEAQSGPLWA